MIVYKRVKHASCRYIYCGPSIIYACTLTHNQHERHVEGSISSNHLLYIFPLTYK